MIRISPKWLSVQAKREFRRINNISYWNDNKDKICQYWVGPQSYKFIIIAVILVYLFSLIPLHLNIFLYSRESVLDLLNARLTNFIVILSVTITVFVFIINALNTRRADDDILTIVFNDSWMYPILYFSLTNIGIALILTYTNKSSWMPTQRLIDWTVLFLYMFIANLIGIGRLYFKIFYYLKSDYINNLQISYFQLNFRLSLKEELLTKLSYKIYVNTLNNEKCKLELERYDLTSKKEENKKVFLKEIGSYIRDVNLRKLKRILIKRKNITKGDCIRVLYIDKRIYASDLAFYINDLKTVNKLNKKLKNIIKTRK